MIAAADRRLFRPTLALTLAMSLAVLATGCPKPAAPIRPVPPAAPTFDPVQGAYIWYDRSRDGDLLRVELEVWQLAEKDNSILGTARRRVWIIAEGGSPLTCNQGHWFESTAEFQIKGKRDGRKVTLQEIAVATEPSPCDDGYRELSSYSGVHAGNALHLQYKDGSQILRKQPNAPPLPSPRLTAPEVTGTYEWSTRSETDAEVRIESELWQFVQTGDNVDGSYVRRVSVTSKSGPFRCNGKPTKGWVDRYTLSGDRNGDSITVLEIAANPAPPDRCNPYVERALDGANGVVFPNAVQLHWRGQRRQVLRRQRPAPSIKAPAARAKGASM